MRKLLEMLRTRQFEGQTNKQTKAHLNESFAIGSTIAVTDGQVHALLSVLDLALLQKVHDILCCAVPGQASQLHDVTIVHVALAHVFLEMKNAKIVNSFKTRW